MSFLRTLSLARCCNALLNPATSCPIFRLPSFPSPPSHQHAKWKITDFAKKTGDYSSLSAVDIQVMALTYQLEKEHTGTDHLHSVPRIDRVATFSEQLPSADLCMAGFYMPPKKDDPMFCEVKKCSHGAPEETEEEAVYKLFPTFSKSVVKNQKAPEDTEDNGMYVLMTHNRIQIVPGDTEDSYYPCGRKIKNKFAPEDVEEEAWHKSNPENILSALKGPDEARLELSSAPDDVEEEEAILRARRGQLQYLKLLSFAPEDVEESALHQFAYKHILTRKAPEDVEEEAIHGTPLAYKNAPEEIDEETKHKFLDGNSKLKISHFINLVPEETEDGVFRPINMLHLFNPDSKQTKVMESAPEDVEEDTVHKFVRFPLLSIGSRKYNAPEDVEEEDAGEAALRPVNLIMNSGNQLGQRWKTAPEEVDEEETSSFHKKWVLPTGKKNLHSVPTDETDESLYKPYPIGVKYVSQCITKDIITSSVGREVNSEDLEKENVIGSDKLTTELKPEKKVLNPEETVLQTKEELGEEKFRKMALEAEAEEAQAMKQLEEALRKAEVSDDADILEVGERSDEEVLYSGEEGFASESDDSDIWDDQAWITPENIDDAKRELQSATEVNSSVKVACITGDFAMQNVLRQIGLHAMAADGRTIKQLRTYILRCYACNKTTSKVELLFCPHCGNKTLRKAAVMLKEDGTEEIKFVWRRPPTGKGKKFPIPRPQGGLHANNPILCADQRLPPQFVSKLARTKNNPLDPDYIAGYSPFVLRDVTSKSAVLGIRSNHTQVKNWMRRDPNVGVKGKGKKRR